MPKHMKELNYGYPTATHWFTKTWNGLFRDLQSTRAHDDVIKWKHFPRYWPFVWWPVNGEFPSQRPVMLSFDVFFDLCPNKRLSKQSWGCWFDVTRTLPLLVSYHLSTPFDHFILMSSLFLKPSSLYIFYTLRSLVNDFELKKKWLS